MTRMLFPHIAIIGLGLIGGSIALDLRARELCKKITGVSILEKDRKSAVLRSAVDYVYPEPGDFLQDVDLVILAVPVRQIIPLFKNIQPFLKPTALVTDVGSVKAPIVREANRLKSFPFIGGHPIAGTEKSGMQAAEIGLFEQKKWILTPEKNVSDHLLHRLIFLIEKLGAEVILMDPRAHDRIFAAVSHLPNLLAYMLANTIDRIKDPQSLAFSGSSLKDMTRLASSPPQMWRDICLANRAPILRMLRRFKTDFERFLDLFESGEEKKLSEFFERGNVFRETLMASISSKNPVKK